MLLPLRKDPYATLKAKKRTAYTDDEELLFAELDDSIFWKEHKARRRREMSTNEKAHVAYKCRLNADKLAELKVKAAKSVESSAAFIKASKTATEKKAVGLDGETDDDDNYDSEKGSQPSESGDQKAKDHNETTAPKNAEKVDSQAIEDEDPGGRDGAKKRVDPPAVKMSEDVAKAMIKGTRYEDFEIVAKDQSKVRFMSPYERNKYWNAMREKALNLLYDLIREKNVDMTSAYLTVLCKIGSLPEKEEPIGPTEEQLAKANSAENQALLARFKPPTPRAVEPPPPLNILQKLGPLLDVNGTTKVGLSPLHVAAGTGHVPTLKLLVEAWGADLRRTNDDGYADYGYSIYQHALNAVSKGLADERGLDWLQIQGANKGLKPDSRIGRHTSKLIAIKDAKERKKEQAKLDAKKAKIRERRKNRARQAKGKKKKKKNDSSA